MSWLLMDKPDRPLQRWMNHNPETIELRSARVTEPDDPLFVRLRNNLAVRSHVHLNGTGGKPAQQVDLTQDSERFRPSFTTFDGNADWYAEKAAKEKGDA
jgi:hypothetical protein